MRHHRRNSSTSRHSAAVRVAAAAALGAAALAACPAAARAQVRVAPPSAPVAPARRFTLSFHNADASDVLRAVALQSGVSVAASPSVKGKVISVRLREVTAEEALQVVAQAAGLTYRRGAGNTYVVGTEAELKNARAGAAEATGVYAPRHLPAAGAEALLAGALPDVSVRPVPGSGTVLIIGSRADVARAQALLATADVPSAPVAEVVTPRAVTADFLGGVLRQAVPEVSTEVRENTLIVTGPREAVSRALALAPSIDTPGGAAQRVEVYRIRYSSAAALTAMLTAALPGVQVTPSAEPYAPPPAVFQPLTSSGAFNTGGGVGGGVGGGGVVGMGFGGGAGGGLAGGAPVVKSRQLVLTGPDAQIAQALRLLGQVDVAPAQVTIEARIVDLTGDYNRDLGILWGGQRIEQTAGGGGQQQEPAFTQGSTDVFVNEQNVPSFFRFGTFLRSPLDFAAQLNFLETRGRSRTLANPRISVVDNEDANIFIGDIRRFQILAVSSATAGNAFTVQEIPVGIALLVRPRVNASGDITVKVHPVVSTLTGLVNGLPQTASREADTTLRVRSGDTIAIGGLIREVDIQTVQQVPFLGDIPLFGELFKRRQTNKQKSEVVLFLTIRLATQDDGGGGSAAPVVPPGALGALGAPSAGAEK